jgi:hypothetical protein
LLKIASASTLVLATNLTLKARFNMTSKFQIGDMIQSSSAPHVVFLVRAFENAIYTLSPPDPDANWVDLPQEEVETFYRKNATGFRHEEKKFN